jgi:hypothetical protein
MRLGKSLAKEPAMPDSRTVRLVKHYDRPDFKTRPRPGDIAAKLRLELKIAEMELRQRHDQIRRFREEIEDMIKLLTAAVEEDKQETAEQLRRRISRLRGSLEYKGRCDFSLTER